MTNKTKIKLFTSLLTAVIATLVFAFNAHACASCDDEHHLDSNANTTIKEFSLRDLERFNVRPVINNIPSFDANGVFSIKRQIIEIGTQQIMPCPDNPDYIFVITHNGMFDILAEDLARINPEYAALLSRQSFRIRYLPVTTITSERIHIKNLYLDNTAQNRCAIAQHIGPIAFTHIRDSFAHNHEAPFPPWACGKTITYHWVCTACNIIGTETHFILIWCMGN
ncbi:MAG: hypothetical protein FWC95_05240 [Defluviitaleaceae bacterium]|nr:hypothetical protein [Defluviitaleaceae bacterium]